MKPDPKAQSANDVTDHESIDLTGKPRLTLSPKKMRIRSSTSIRLHMTSPHGQYEFNAKENKELTELSTKVRFGSAAVFLLGLLDAMTLLASLKALSSIQVLIGIVTVLATLYTVYSLWMASTRMVRIVKSEGEDMGLLFQSTQRLENAFVAISIGILGHIIGTFDYHEMMYGPYSIFNSAKM